MNPSFNNNNNSVQAAGGANHTQRREAIETLISNLSQRDVHLRDQARAALVAYGKSAIPPLQEAIHNPSDTVRWEVLKALCEIDDPAITPTLVAALEDARFGVRWLAAEGLIRLGYEGVDELLQALIHARWDAVWLREGAHHVLRVLSGRSWGRPLIPVVVALEGAEPSVTVPRAAYKALAELSTLTP